MLLKNPGPCGLGPRAAVGGWQLGERYKTAKLSSLRAGESRERWAIDPKRTSAKSGGPRKGQTLRLNPEAWKQLKLLALERETSSHDLLIEALNALFRRHGKPPVV